jgi:large subunit ribosomal protein L9
MKIILLEDIEKVGKKYDVKEVKDGYARNFLIPKNLVKIANAKNMKWLEAQKQTKSAIAEEDLKKVEARASAIDGQEIVISVKVGDKGQLFESITGHKISEKIKELGTVVDADQIILDEPIKELGEFPIKIKFEHNLEAEVKIIISEEV